MNVFWGHALFPSLSVKSLKSSCRGDPLGLSQYHILRGPALGLIFREMVKSLRVLSDSLKNGSDDKIYTHFFGLIEK